MSVTISSATFGVIVAICFTPRDSIVTSLKVISIACNLIDVDGSSFVTSIVSSPSNVSPAKFGAKLPKTCTRIRCPFKNTLLVIKFGSKI